MAAGNTFAEAVVQGISEILERFVHKALFTLKSGLPDIPDKFLEKYPELYEKYCKLRTIPGYDIRVKDCSFNGQFPVVGLLILQKNTSRYGIKLGCHPDFGIALERTLTEAAQGTDILEYINRSTVDFFNANVTDWVNMTNSFKVGMSQYPYQIISDMSSFKFTKPRDVSHMNNQDLAQNLIKRLAANGYDVLIRNVSTLGFPSCHIIIPGLSELIDASDDKIRAYNTRAFVSALLQNPEDINAENCKYVIASVGYFSRSLMENGLESYYQDIGKAKLPYNEIGGSAIYLAAMCHVILGDYLNAYKKISILERHAYGAKDKTLMAHLKCTAMYLSGMAVMRNHREVMRYLNRMFDKNLCVEIDRLFKDPSKVVVLQFPNVSSDMETSQIINQIYKYADILKREQIKNPINQEKVRDMLNI